MDLQSDSFPADGWIPRRYSGEGEDVSPALRWSGVPAGVGSFALILDDPDAPPGLWIHWVLYNVSPELRDLPEGVAPLERLENGALHGACWGVDHFSRTGYAGPLPPPGPPHRYRFHLSALDGPLGLPPGASAAEVRAAMEGHILAEAELVGLYQHGHG